MKKFYSLFKASMTDGMSLFKINGKKDNKLILIAIPIFLMLSIGTSAYHFFEELSVTHMQFVLLGVMTIGISIFTLIEGIYKSGSLLFNCNDDQLLLSMPIKKSNILLLRIIKFYIFELLFNSIFILPFMVSYIFWEDNLAWTYYLTSIIMLLLMPIIPIIISCVIGFITTHISGKFKKKNIVQIAISFVVLIGVLFLSSNSQNYLNYLIKNVGSINELISRLYYPAGVYIKLITDFNIGDLFIFIFINITILVLAIFLLNRFYFKINSQNKKIMVNSKRITSSFKTKSPYYSFIKKELNTFFNIPVLLINSGFALVLFIIIVILAATHFNSILNILSSNPDINISKDLIINNISVFIFILISLTSYMTSITSSVISLEGKSINLLKSLPIKFKDILLSKIIACLIITTPVLFIGNIILFIRFKIGFAEGLLLLLLSILVPLVSHYIGLIINLRYPKFDATTDAEVVKQSISSLLSVFLGIILFIISFALIYKALGHYSSITILSISSIIYILLNIALYIYLNIIGTKQFGNLSN